MNIQELVVQLNTRLEWVGNPSRVANSDVAPLPETWVVPIIDYQANTADKYQIPTNWRFTVLNRGVEVGPQTYDSDVFDDSEPPVLIHSAGDPILDENGDQVVIAEADAERVLLNNDTEKPPVLLGQFRTFLDTLIPSPYIRCEVETVDEDSLYGFAKAWKVTSGTEAAEVRLIVWKDQGSPVAYREIV